MASPTIAKASRVERALERLEAAVDRLDVALTDGRINGAAAEGLDQLRRENVELRDLNRAAAERLAGAIQRLDGLLDADRGA